MHLAESALQKAFAESDAVGIARSKWMLGRILLVTGIYENNKDKFKEALVCLNGDMVTDAPLDESLHIGMDSTRAEIHLALRQFEKATEYYEKNLRIARANADTEKIVLSLLGLSDVQVQQNEFNAALELSSEALALMIQESPENDSLKAEVFHQLSKVYLKKQDYTKILEFSQPVLEISRRLGDVEKELTALNNIAIVRGVQSDYKTAMQLLLEAYEKSSQIHFRHSIANCLVNIGTIYAHLFNYEDALDRYRTVLSDYKDVLSNHTHIIINNNVGNIYFSTEQLQLAKDHFEKALHLSKEAHYKEMIAHTLAQLSRTCIAMGRLDEAREDAARAQQMIEELGGKVSGKQINLLNLSQISYHDREIEKAIRLAKHGIAVAGRMKDEATGIRGYKLLSDIYRDLKDYAKALRCYSMFAQVQTEYTNIQRSRQIIDLEIRYAIQEKQRKIEQLTRENEYQALLLEKSDQIEKQNVQLIQANEELRQFAYVASHDLKEPLRMIGSFTQLLYRYFGDKVDDDSKVFFDYINEGVIRMNNLLDALLKYATIGKIQEESDRVNMNDVIEVCKSNLKLLIEETKSIVYAEHLPVVRSVQSLLVQLFQNLISNAIKFRKTDLRPVIIITAQEEEFEYIFQIKDNGIGIDPEHHERIFVIFQRLHTRTKYEGTGIGLAICYKIVQQLGGRIWVDSQLNDGASFYFTIPK